MNQLREENMTPTERFEHFLTQKASPPPSTDLEKLQEGISNQGRSFDKFLCSMDRTNPQKKENKLKDPIIQSIETIVKNKPINRNDKQNILEYLIKLRPTISAEKTLPIHCLHESDVRYTIFLLSDKNTPTVKREAFIKIKHSLIQIIRIYDIKEDVSESSDSLDLDIDVDNPADVSKFISQLRRKNMLGMKDGHLSVDDDAEKCNIQ